jgi:hypothetical protein
MLQALRASAAAMATRREKVGERFTDHILGKAK